MYRGQWRTTLTRPEQRRGWVFFALYFLVFPFLMSWVQQAAGGEWPAAEANTIYYLLLVALAFLLLWDFLKRNFALLLDWLPENLFAFVTGLAGAGVLHLLVMRLPYPVDDPNVFHYQMEYLLSPRATVVILVLLMPMIEEVLFRGLLFGSIRAYSRVLAYLLSVMLFCLSSVWQFVFSFGVVDPRYLLRMAQYLPMALALTWCYDAGGSIWSSVALHAILNAFRLFSALRST